MCIRHPFYCLTFSTDFQSTFEDLCPPLLSGTPHSTKHFCPFSSCVASWADLHENLESYSLKSQYGFICRKKTMMTKRKFWIIITHIPYSWCWHEVSACNGSKLTIKQLKSRLSVFLLSEVTLEENLEEVLTRHSLGCTQKQERTLSFFSLLSNSGILI